MIDIILAIVIVGILSLAIGYIVRAKRRGVKCIGCSACSGSSVKQESTTDCGGGCSGCSGSCHCND